MNYQAFNAETYKKMEKEAIENPTKFWSETAKDILKWESTDFKNIIGKIGDEKSCWFEGGKINTCYNAVDRHAMAHPDKVALLYEGNDIDDSRQMTYGELLQNVCKMANVLKSKGVTKGSHVAIYFPVSIEGIVSMLACARIGAIHTVIFGAFSGDALSYRIHNSDATVVISQESYKRAAKAIPMKTTLLNALKSCPNIKNVIISGLTEKPTEKLPYEVESYQELMAAASDKCDCEIMDGSDPLFILYTSGSTGEPKGIIHRVGGYTVATTLTFKYVFDTNEKSIFGCTSDIGWITGHSYVCYGPLLNGSTTLIFGGLPLWPDATRSWQLIQKLKLTHFYTSPSAARAIAAKIKSVDQVSQFDISSLRVIGSVGETLDEDTCIYMRTVLGRDKCWLVDTYWQTELGSIIATSVPGIENLPPGIVGRPLFGTEIVLAEPNGQIISTTRNPHPEIVHNGILCIATPWPGLANAAFKSTRSFKDRYIMQGTEFFLAGDTAQIDTKGNIRITGRIDDQLCVNGHRVGPAEVEEAILKVDGVEDVAVIGVPSKKTTQAIIAFVVSADNSQEMVTKVAVKVTQNFGAIGRPQKVIFVKMLPKTNSAKIIRSYLRELFLNVDNNKSVPKPTACTMTQEEIGELIDIIKGTQTDLASL